MHSQVPLHALKQLVTQQPHLIWQVVASLLRKHFTVNYDYYFKNGTSAMPRMVSLKITNRCNLRCKMCAQWGEAGYNLNRTKEVVNNELSFMVYKKLIDDVVPFNPIFYIWGGEPFLYSDIMDVLCYLKEKKLTTTIVTNGVRLVDSAEKLVKMQLEGLLVSLDGTEKVHNKIRGSTNNYQCLMEGIEEVCRLKKKHRSSLPYIVFLVTISRDNVHELEKIFEIAEDAECDAVICYYSWFTTSEIGNQHTKIFQKRLDCTPTTWRGYLLPVEQVDTKAVQENVINIQSRRWKFRYFFLPNLTIEQIPQYYKNPIETFRYARCVAPWLITEIMPNGDVATCRDFSDYITGNIARDSILQLWNNERYKLFRTSLRDEGLFPICSRCCGLMGF